MSDGEFIGRIISRPGIQRDGTEFDSGSYIDGLWCRWQRGRPRKMGGYTSIFDAINETQRSASMVAKAGQFYIHSGSASLLSRFIISSAGLPLGYITRTPASFAASAANSWQFAVMYDPAGGDSTIFAHAAPNLSSISSDTLGKIYYGPLTGAAPLAELVGGDVSGGVCALYPYLFRYSSDGFIGWSDRGDPLNLTSGDANAFRATGEKVVLGAPTRAGGGSAPSGLFFATDALIRASYIGGEAIFGFDRFSEGYSILSPSSVVEYNGVYYWPGADGRFLSYNGVLNELENPMNSNWFFENLNWEHSQKVWGTIVPRFGEIWWHFPFGSNTECSNAIIYNIREKTFYDTASARSCGIHPRTFRKPLWFGANPENFAFTVMWMHETGVDKVLAANPLAIESYFETADYFLPLPAGEMMGKPEVNTLVQRIEPDFIQTGNMGLVVSGRSFAKSELTSLPLRSFAPEDTAVDVNAQFRQMRFKFSSNELGGNYQGGKTISIMGPGDSQPV